MVAASQGSLRRSGRRDVRRWLCGGIAGAAVACASLQQALRFQEPSVQLQEIRVTGLGLSGGTLDLELDVFNPNEFRLRTLRMELGIDLEQVHFGDAVLESAIELPSQQHTLVTVPVRFEWAGVGAGARGLLTRQAIRYGLSGVATLGTPIGDRRVGLHGSGEVPLRALRP